MTTLFTLIFLAVMPMAAERYGYQVKASCYPYATVNLSADAQPGDMVVWQLPSVVRFTVSRDGHYATLWVPGTDDEGSPVKYWSGKFDASYTVYRAGRPPRRVEFFLIVR